MATRTRARPAVEQLEDRNLMAGSALNAAGVLVIQGTGGADRVRVSAAGGQVTVTANGGFREVRSFAASSVRRIVFLGRGGGDVFLNQTPLPGQAFGGAGADLFVGGGGNDVLVGLGGPDRLYGGGGDDRLVGGGGQNLLVGGPGADTLVSTSGLDTLLPGPQAPAARAVTGLNADQALIFNMTNHWRASSGLQPLHLDPLLQLVAQRHADNMARQDKYGDDDQNGHILDGHDFVWRLAQVNYNWAEAGENVAYNFGYANPALTMAWQWWDSPPHRENILYPSYTAFGVGIARGASGRTYGVQLFALPA